MMWRRPTADELRGTGLLPSHYKEPNVEVWPENWPALDLYMRYQTQWIQGAAGPAGLNYAILLSDLEKQGLDEEQVEDVMEGIRIIENSVLEHFHS